MKLMLKGIKCETAKCQIERRQKNLAPGMHGWRRGRSSEYGVRMRETQKIKRFYGIFDRQFMRYFRLAEKSPGNTGQMLLQLLERRLDNVIYKLNWAPSRKAARETINQGHIYVNGKKVDVGSYSVSVGDKISVKNSQKAAKNQKHESNLIPIQNGCGRQDKPEATIVALPSEDVDSY
jgi:small subunit ribosomal protein S4